MRLIKKPNYGLDAPTVVRNWGFVGLTGLVLTILGSKFLPAHWAASILITLAYTISFSFLIPSITIPLGSFFFKFKDREWLFNELKLTGTEKVLDVGCGHGLLLIAAAKRLSTGSAHGLDLWQQEDQASNSREAALENAMIEGVANRLEIHNGDMRKMPFNDSDFDVIVSSWAIHNIYDKGQREQALGEIARVLKPGGKLAILDIDYAPEYRDFYAKTGFENPRLLGPRFTFGNRTYLLMASKPLKKNHEGSSLRH